MKHIHTLFVGVLLLSSCANVKNIYNSNNVNDRQYDKLVKQYLKNTSDTALSNRVIFAYNSILNDKLERIESLKQNNSLQAKENLIYAYDDLQGFYNSSGPVSSLVKPGNVQQQRQRALENAAAMWYEHGDYLMSLGNWSSGREALNVYQKVNRWIPGYRDVRRSLEDARELATVDAVIQPLKNEGFFYVSTYSPLGERFSNQLVSDLSGSWNSAGLYRIYNAQEATFRNIAADWLVEPVITRFQADPVVYTKTSRTVTKQIEIGKDSSKIPIYKTISAVLNITEESVCVSSEIDARISDIADNQRIGRRSFTENITLKEVSATFTGDKNALSNDDWALINNRNRVRTDDRWLQGRLLEKLYPQVLDYLRSILR